MRGASGLKRRKLQVSLMVKRNGFRYHTFRLQYSVLLYLRADEVVVEEDVAEGIKGDEEVTLRMEAWLWETDRSVVGQLSLVEMLHPSEPGETWVLLDLALCSRGLEDQPVLDLQHRGINENQATRNMIGVMRLDRSRLVVPVHMRTVGHRHRPRPRASRAVNGTLLRQVEDSNPLVLIGSKHNSMVPKITAIRVGIVEMKIWEGHKTIPGMRMDLDNTESEAKVDTNVAEVVTVGAEAGIMASAAINRSSAPQTTRVTTDSRPQSHIHTMITDIHHSRKVQHSHFHVMANITVPTHDPNQSRIQTVLVESPATHHQQGPLTYIYRLTWQTYTDINLLTKVR